MKMNKSIIALAISASLGLSGQVFAIGTTAAIDITNEATLTFDVDGVSQTPQADTATFKVDNKIDLNLEWNDTTAPTTVSGADGVAISYKLYNAGNSLQSYELSGTHLGTDGTTVGAYSTEYQTGAAPVVPFPAVPGYSYTFYQEEGTSTGFQAGEDTLLAGGITADIAPVAATADLSDDAKATIVYLVVDNILADAIDTDILGFNLTAETFTSSVAASPNVAETEDGLADNPALVQAVFADSSNDGKENADGALEIVTAKLEITKAVAVTSDPINNATNPKAIPGATLQYTITVTNTGRAAADTVIVTEDLTKVDANNVNLGQLDTSKIANLDTTGSTTATSQADFITNKILVVNYASIPAGNVTPQTRTISFEIDIQ